MAYCGYADLLNEIDALTLGAMSNDYNGNQEVNQSVISSVCQYASNSCDALVASIYRTPFNNPPPAKIYNAAIAFACEALYNRRRTSTQENPFKDKADEWRKELIAVGSGQHPLDANFTREFTPVVIKYSRSRIDSNIY